MRARSLLWTVPLLFLLLTASAAGAPGGHYTPLAGDDFHYFETITVGNGVGSYLGYSDITFINGSLGVTAVAPNGSVSATYASAYSYSNSNGGSQRGSSGGSFTFSAQTFLYLQGTDNQTGYTNPSVWFYVNNSLAAGGHLELLNTPMTVVSTTSSYPLPTDPSRSVRTISAQGTSQYQRDDSYGVFTASYTWQAYFDPSTGYIVGYSYTEQDTDGAGNGFTYTDVLSVTSTSYPLTTSSVSSSASSSSGLSNATILVIAAVVVVVVVLLVLLALRSRRGASLPRHSRTGRVEYGTMPMPPPPPMGGGMAPPAIHLTGAQQPAVQQVVLRETVKVNCQYCGTLIDSTATVCPNCGAPRT